MTNNNGSKRNKARTKYIILTIVAMIVTFLPIFFLPMIRHTPKTEKAIDVFSMIMMIPGIFFGFKVVQATYDKDKLAKGPLFIPKSFGYGLSINPYHPVGKVIWGLLGAVIVFFLVKFILTPA
ncbi:MAG: hypothetical protein LKF36_09015 [Lactobacillus sp.]|jgi:uncharacterized membrane protein|nr:hypothetical protein [Lactobacillus sp.]